VCSYGEQDLSKDMLSVYMQGGNETVFKPEPFRPSSHLAVDQRVVEEGMLKAKYEMAHTPEEKAGLALEMEELQQQRRETQAFFLKFGIQTLGLKYKSQLKDFKDLLPKILDGDIKSKIPTPKSACDVNQIGQMVFDNFQCYKRVTEMVRSTCGPLDSYALQFTPVFASLCQLTNADYEAMHATTQSLCPSPIWQ